MGRTVPHVYARTAERNALFFGNPHAVWRVRQQNAARFRSTSARRRIYAKLIIGRIAKMHAQQLQPIHIDLFVIQDADSSTLHRIHVLGVIGKLFMISGHKIGPQRRRELAPGCGQFVYLAAVPSYISPAISTSSGATRQLRHNAPHKSECSNWPRCVSLTSAATLPRQDSADWAA